MEPEGSLPHSQEPATSSSPEPDRRGAHKVLVGRPDGKRPLWRPRRKQEDNIKMDVKEIGWGVDWIDTAQGRYKWRAVVNTIMNS